MTVVFTAGAAVILFTVALAWAQRSGSVLTLRDPLIWLFASGAILEVALVRVPPSPALLLAIGTVCALTDRQTGYIFNAVLLVGGALLMASVVATGDIATSVLATGICGGAMLFLHIATRGRGLGLGDVKLAALIGGGLGVPAGIEALGAAFVVGALTIVATTPARRVRACGAVAFGPYLAVGTMLSVAFAGTQ